MKQGRSTGNMTKLEARWVSATKRNGCQCCIARGYEPEDGSIVDAHHLLSGGIRRGHLYTVGLCAWHHRGALTVLGWTNATHRRLLGPSLAEGSVPFHEAFGTDHDLLAWQIARNAGAQLRNAA